jgi:hypothetical protein
MANGPNGPAAVPAWLAPLTDTIKTLGIPTVFAVVLLWFTLTKLDSALRVIMDNEEARTTKLTVLENAFVAAIDRQTVAYQTAMQANLQALRDATEAERQQAAVTQRLLTEGKANPP